MSRVLVVDDEPAFRPFARRVLEGGGYAVEVAGDGASAERAVACRRPGVVVTDLFMPEVDGLELTRGLARDYPGLPVVAVSSGGQARLIDLLAVAAELGVVATPDKPVSPKTLLVAVGRATDPTAPRAGFATLGRVATAGNRAADTG